MRGSSGSALGLCGPWHLQRQSARRVRGHAARDRLAEPPARPCS